MKYLVLVIGLSLFGGAVSANCNAKNLSHNGLYYSETGKEIDARRIDLTKFGEKRFLSLRGRISQPYSSTGRFFLRSGVAGQPWLVIPPAKKREAVIIRRITQSHEGTPASYVSISRKNLNEQACPALGKQDGLHDERNFVDTTEYMLFHSDQAEMRRNPRLNKQFHFEFEKSTSACTHTTDLVDARGERFTRRAYLGREDVDTTTTAEALIERSATGFAELFLPSPAYASQPDARAVVNEKALIVSSMEVSLFDISSGNNTCLDFPVPIPTSKVAKGVFAWFFRGAASHERRAQRMAQNGEWTPYLSEFFIQQVENSSQSALIRVLWR